MHHSPTGRELAVGERCVGRGGRRRLSELHGNAEPGAVGDGERKLSDLGRDSQGRVGLQGDLGLAVLRARADGEDGHRAGAGRRAGRGLRDADADGVEQEPAAYERCGPDRDRDDLQHRQDADGVDRALRAHGGRSGAGCGGRADAGEPGAGRRDPPRGTADRPRAAVRSRNGRGRRVGGGPGAGAGIRPAPEQRRPGAPGRRTAPRFAGVRTGRSRPRPAAGHVILDDGGDRRPGLRVDLGPGRGDALLGSRRRSRAGRRRGDRPAWRGLDTRAVDDRDCWSRTAWATAATGARAPTR